MFWKIEGIDDVDYLSVKLGVILSILIFSLFSTVNMYFFKLKTFNFKNWKTFNSSLSIKNWSCCFSLGKKELK